MNISRMKANFNGDSEDRATEGRSAKINNSPQTRRPDDTFGLAGVMSGISSVNRNFLAAGGMGILDGDGALNYGWETVLEAYYDCGIWRNIHLAVDYQFIADPAFNRARGPVSVLSTRWHWDF